MTNGYIEKIKKECLKLCEEGVELSKKFDNPLEVAIPYQSWYNKSLYLIKTIIPERLAEFCSYYNRKEYKVFDFSKYSIQDYLSGLQPAKPLVIVKDLPACAISMFLQQIAIVQSIEEFVESVARSLNFEIIAEVNDTEIKTARKLLRYNVRASGCIVGVVLESHLKRVLKKYNPLDKTKDKDLNLSVLNDKLRELHIIDDVLWRKIQWLSDIRNLCDHNKIDEVTGQTIEPQKDDVKDFIDSTEKIIKIIN